MPTKRFSTRSTRPMPCLPPSLFSALSTPAGRELLAVHRDAVALLEIEFDVFRLVRRVLGRDGELEHALVRLRRRIEPRILEDAGLVGNMEEVAIHRIRLLERGLDRESCASRSTRSSRRDREIRSRNVVDLPRREDLRAAGERHVGELEAALVVALAGGAVRDGVGLFLAARSRPAPWRSAAARSRCRGSTGPRRSRWPGSSGR